MEKSKSVLTCTRILYLFFIIACIANLLLSVYITVQKNHNDTVAVEECFLGDGGCYTVQTSIYAKTFGIANPYYGMGFFGIGILLFSLLLANSYRAFIPKLYLKEGLDIIQFFLIIGAVFSIWLLYVQFFILVTTCKYCLWVDAIMIVMLVLFSVYKKKFVDEK